MIKANALKPADTPGYRLTGPTATHLTLDLLEALVTAENISAYDLPLVFERDEVKSGGLFNSSVQKCLIIKHKEHLNDYFAYCLTLHIQGKIMTLAVNYFGISTLTQKAHQTEARRGQGLGGLLANAVFGVDEVAYRTEYEYYSMLENLIGSAIS